MSCATSYLPEDMIIKGGWFRTFFSNLWNYYFSALHIISQELNILIELSTSFCKLDIISRALKYIFPTIPHHFSWVMESFLENSTLPTPIQTRLYTKCINLRITGRSQDVRLYLDLCPLNLGLWSWPSMRVCQSWGRHCDIKIKMSKTRAHKDIEKEKLA